MKTILTLMLALVSYTLFSQTSSRHSLFLDAGYSYNSSVAIMETPVDGSRSSNVTIGLNYRIFSYKKFQTTLGFATKLVYAQGEHKDNAFNARTFRLGIPLTFTFQINDKWAVSSGFFLQNNVDRSEFDLRLRDKYSYRVNFIPELSYKLSKQWQVNIKGHFNLRDMPDAYVINDPRIGFSAGVSRSIFLIGKSKN